LLVDAADHKSSDLMSDRLSDDSLVHSDTLIFSGTALRNIGRHLAWIYTHTRLSSLCQGIYHLYVLLTVFENAKFCGVQIFKIYYTWLFCPVNFESAVNYSAITFRTYSKTMQHEQVYNYLDGLIM